MNCRYGTDRIGSIGVKITTMAQHALMRMRRMTNITLASDLEPRLAYRSL